MIPSLSAAFRSSTKKLEQSAARRTRWGQIKVPQWGQLKVPRPLADHGALAEVYGDTQLVSERDSDRRLSALVASRPLRLIALEDPTVQKTLGLDGRIAMSKQYATTMLWSRALHRWFPKADGIRYASRHAGGQFPNFCLFLDRSRAALRVEPRGKLGDPALRLLLLDAADRYLLTVLIPRSR